MTKKNEEANKEKQMVINAIRGLFTTYSPLSIMFIDVLITDSEADDLHLLELEALCKKNQNDDGIKDCERILEELKKYSLDERYSIIELAENFDEDDEDEDFF